MIDLDRWSAALSRLEDASNEFHQACLTVLSEALRALDSHTHQPVLENVVSTIHSKIEVISLSEQRLSSSRYVINSLLNCSTVRMPINKLPTEILGNIFHNVRFSKQPSEEIEDNPLEKISLVCTQWRNLALCTPSLWSSIDIYTRSLNIPNGFYTRLLNRIGLCLQRSNDLPIHLYLYDHDEGTRSPQRLKFISDFTPVLEPSVSRWTRLVIDSFYSSEIASGILSMASKFDCLISASLQEWGNLNATVLWPADHWTKLTELSVSNIARFACPTSYQIANTIAHCPGLHTLRLGNVKPKLEDERELPQAHLPHLKFLEIRAGYDLVALSLVSAIFPGTEELDFRLTWRPDDDQYPAAVQELTLLMKRSNIVSLALGYADLSNMLPQPFLSCAPGLRTLQLQYTSSSFSINELFGADGFDMFYTLPKLQSLCLAVVGFDRPALKELRELISEHALRHLVFINCHFYRSLRSPIAAEWGGSDIGEEYSSDDDNNNQGQNDRADEDDSGQGESSELHQGGRDSDSDLWPFIEASNKEVTVPERVRARLPGVEKIRAYDGWPGWVYRGEDWFTQELIRVD